MAVLEKSVAILERELNEKNSQIAAMNERLRESNILMKDLQLRVALPPAKEVPPTTTDVTATEREQTEANKPTSKRPFRWLFGR